MSNPNPNLENLELGKWKKGQSGNPAGKPKGSKNLSTIVRELENDNFDWKFVPTKQRDAVKQIGSPWRAIVYKAVAEALEGNIKAAEWLRKSGYGDKLDITSGGEQIQPVMVVDLGNLNADIDQAESDSPSNRFISKPRGLFCGSINRRFAIVS